MQILTQRIKDIPRVDRPREEVKLHGLESLNNKQAETQLTLFDIFDLSPPKYISATHPVTMLKKKSLVKNGGRKELSQIQSRRYLVVHFINNVTYYLLTFS